MPAKDLLSELTDRIEYADSVVVFVKSKQGNHFLMESSNTTAADLKAAKKMIADSIAQKRDN